MVNKGSVSLTNYEKYSLELLKSRLSRAELRMREIEDHNCKIFKKLKSVDSKIPKFSLPIHPSITNFSFNEINEPYKTALKFKLRNKSAAALPSLTWR